ncbi:GNAT family N-acetyltransferase [Neisseria canis]|uniref:Uncharacterized protein involved in methicillin resistance n=1 Tax=Neisseria canis TaxID=493 RepID=A0A1X3CSJ5_9NEIS|nr:GNAT family N-acetyltransferase [Neisseria canis]OSI10523.1 hypothetical protein BWD07_10540 [Neisseria canis]VEF03076.1 Uncharacterized protein involved in methicillin resistance [Neisseria canis]
MTLIEICIQDNELWDKTIRSLPVYEPFYLNAYVKALAGHNKDSEPVLLYYENGDVKAATVMFRRDIALSQPFTGKIPENTYFDLSSPYGYGGFIYNTDSFPEEVQQAYNQYCLETGYICEFLRFNLFTDYAQRYDGYAVSPMVNVVCDLSGSWEDVFGRYQGKTRQKVRKIQKSGWSVRVGNTKEDIDTFLPVYYDTMDRNDARSMYYFDKEFFETLHNLGGPIYYFFAEKEGKVGAVNLLIGGNENTYCFLSSTSREYLKESPNYLLMSEMIAWSHANGFKKFVIGGGYGSNDDLLRFKKGFAPEGLYDFYIGNKIFNQEIYNKLLEIRREAGELDENSNFFPLYRA